MICVLKQYQSKKIINFFVIICVLFVGQLFGMQNATKTQQRETKEEEFSEIPRSFSPFKQQDIHLPVNTNTFDITFARLQGSSIINYLLGGHNVARLIQNNQMTRFANSDPRPYNFLFKDKIKTELFVIDANSGFIFKKPIKVSEANLKCKSAEFHDKFSSAHGINLQVNNCDNFGDITCSDILFKGEQFNCLRDSALKVSGDAALLPKIEFVNEGKITCANNLLIDTPSFENRNSLCAKKLNLFGDTLLNQGSIKVADSLLLNCNKFDHKGRLYVKKDCVFDNVNTFLTDQSSLWRVDGNWQANVGKLHLNGNALIGMLALFNIGSYASLDGLLRAPIIRIDSDLLTCSNTAKLIAAHHIGLKAKGWIQYEGDILKRFLNSHAHPDSLKNIESLLETFPHGVFLHSEQSGIKQGGSIVSKKGTVCLDAKKGLTHTGKTEAGFAQDSKLLMRAALLDIQRKSLLQAINAQLSAQDSIEHFGTAQIKDQLVLQAPEIVHGGSSQANNLFVEGGNVRASQSSHISVGNASFNVQEKISNAGTINASETLQMHADEIGLNTTSQVNAKSVQMRANTKIENKGLLKAEENLLTHAKFVENSGSIEAQHAHIKADRLWWNKWGGRVAVDDSLTIDALASVNTLGVIKADDLTINSAFDLNLLGLYRAKNSHLNSLVSLNAGLSVPKFDSLNDLFTYDNALRAGGALFMNLLTKAHPAAGLLCSVGKSLYGMHHQIPALYKHAKQVYSQEDAGVSDWISVICGAKNLAMSAVQTGKMMQQGYEMMNPKDKSDKSKSNSEKSTNSSNKKPETNSKKSAQEKEQKTDWQSVALESASTVVSAVGPQLNRDTLIDINGIQLGVNGNSNSVWNVNGGASLFANRYSINTVYGTNIGVLAASDLNVHAAQTYSSGGILAAINARVTANNLDIAGRVHVGNNSVFEAKNNANIDSKINAKNIHIKAQRVVLKKNINARNGVANVVADDRITLEKGSKVAGDVVALESDTIQGDTGNTIKSKKYTHIKTAHLDNQGSVDGHLAVNFTGKAEDLKHIGTVEHIQYQGTLANDLPDTFANGSNDLVHVKPSGSVTLLADQQKVHLKEQHTIAHGLRVNTHGDLTCDKPIISEGGDVILESHKNIKHSTVKAGGSAAIIAGGTVTAQSTVARSGDSKNYEDHINKVSVTAGNKVDIHAGGHVIHEGVSVHSGKGGTHITAKGKIIAGAKTCEKQTQTHVHTKTEIKNSKDTIRTAHVSEYTSDGQINMQAGDKCELYGTTFNAKGGSSVHGNNGVEGHTVYTSHEHESSYKRDGGWFGQHKTNHEKKATVTAKVVDFKGGQTPTVTSNQKISMPFTSDSSKVILNAPVVERQLAKSVHESAGKSTSSNLVWQSEQSYQNEDVTYTPMFEGSIETNAREIYIDQVEGRSPEQLVNTNKDAHVNYRRAFSEVHKHQEHSFQGPTKAVRAVLALAITMATSGIGASVGGGLAVAAGCTPIGVTAITAASSALVSTYSAQVVDALATCNGDVKAAAKKVASIDTFKKACLSTLTGGMCGAGGHMLSHSGLPVLESATNLGERIMYTAPRQGLNAGFKIVSAVMDEHDFGDAAWDNCKQALANTIGIAGTSQIGDAYKKGQIDPVTHKILHGLTGAAEGFILNGSKGALAGATGAVVSETVTDVLKPKQPSFATIKALEVKHGRVLTEDEFTHAWNKQMQTYMRNVTTVANSAKLAAAMSALITRQDVNIASGTGATAVDNNFLVLAAYGIALASAAYSAYQIHNAYQEGGVQGALKQLGVEVVMVAAGYGVSKVMFKVGGMLYPTAQAAITSLMEISPTTKAIANSVANAIAVGGNKFAQTAAGRRVLLIKSSVHNLESRLLNAQNKILQKVGFGWKKVTGQKAPKPAGLSNSLTDEAKVLHAQHGATEVEKNFSTIASKYKLQTKDLDSSIGNLEQLEKIFATFENTPGALGKDGLLTKVFKCGTVGSKQLSTARGAMYELETAVELTRKGERVTHFGERFKFGDSSRREFDIVTDKCLIECKNVNWNKANIADYKGDFGQQKKIANGLGKEFAVYSKQLIPDNLKSWFVKKDIKFFEG